MSTHKLLVAFMVVLALLIANGALLYGQYRGPHAIPIVAVLAPNPVPSPIAQIPPPTVGTPTATPSIITVNTPTSVTVTVQITDSRLLPGGVNLLRINSSGNPTVLGVMHDDGVNGDAVGNDKVFSLFVSFNEVAAGEVRLQVSAAFRGLLKRILSPIASINVWVSYVSKGDKYALMHPATLSAQQPTSGKTTFTNGNVNLDGDLPAPIEIFAFPVSVQSSGELLQYLRSIIVQNRVETNFVLAGQPATRIVGTLDSNVFGWGGGRHGYVVTEYNAITYQLQYDAEDPSVTSTFDQMLDTLRFQ